MCFTEKTATGWPSSSRMGTCRKPPTAIRLRTYASRSLMVRVSGSGVITSATAVLRASRSAAATRKSTSRSVKMPVSSPPRTIKTHPMPCAFIKSMASATLVSGFTQIAGRGWHLPMGSPISAS
jgi:hypothetical protein